VEQSVVHEVAAGTPADPRRAPTAPSHGAPVVQGDGKI